MINVYERLYKIRKKIEEENFNKIYNFFSENNLEITKNNFNLALSKLNFVENKSYTKYVYFIKEYLYKKRKWK